MQKIILMVVAVVLHGNSANNDVRTIKKLNDEWLHAYVTKDIKVLDRIFAHDFVLINHKGQKTTKQQNLDNLQMQEVSTVHIDSVEVKLVTQDVGILTAYTTFTFPSAGKLLRGKNCYQDVYVKRKGQWQAVSAHVTLLSLE
jgi:uncharacterized protein (TIGR02246 family)